jgi:adenylylsulfate kinase
MAAIAPGATITAACVWLTGPAGAGKRTIASGLVDTLRARGIEATTIDERVASAYLADGVDSIAWLCRLLVSHGVNVVVSVPLPTRDDRELVRDAVPGFVEVFVDRGQRDESYEEPFAPDLRVPTHDREARASIAQLVSWLEDAGVVDAEA